MEDIIFDRRFHKSVFIRRLILAIYTIIIPIIIIFLFYLFNEDDIIFASTLINYLSIFYVIGFIVYSIVILIVDKKVIYDLNKVHHGYKKGFIITKIGSFVQFSISCALLLIFVLVGSIGSSLSKANTYQIDKETNLQPDEVYDFENYKYYYEYEYNYLPYNDSISDINYYENNYRYLLRRYTFSSTIMKYDNIFDYQNACDQFKQNNSFLIDIVVNKKDYVIPLTEFTYNNYNYYVCSTTNLENLTLIGFNISEKTIVWLKSDGSRYENFGKNRKNAEEAFKDYIIKMYYLPGEEISEGE